MTPLTPRQRTDKIFTMLQLPAQYNSLNGIPEGAYLDVENEIVQAEREALEKAAEVAETIYGTRFHDKAERRTGKKIAANIRSLLPTPEPRKA